MNKIIVHIPHSSLKLPDIFYDKVTLSKEEILNENKKLCDIYVDKFIEKGNYTIVKFDYSRLFCDVEKFKDDNKEVMSKVGMGCVYTHTSQGQKFINYDAKYKKTVLDKYYDSHHNKIDKLVSKILKKEAKCLILDLHSFSEEQANNTLGLYNTPDICIGIDEEFKDEKLKQITYTHFKRKGYDVKVNFPYQGTFVPNIAYINKDKRVKSIMIELNKRLYLNDNYDEINSKKFDKLKSVIKEYMEILINYSNEE